MNIEICERCRGHKVIFWDTPITNFDRARIFITFSNNNSMCNSCFKSVSNSRKELVVMCNKKFSLMSDIKSWLFNQNRMIMGFDKLKLDDRECPYFLEHQLYDWNKK